MALSKIPSDLLEGAVSFNSAAPADSLTIDASGNVGIGTSSPSTKLQINTGSSYSGVRLKGTSSASSGFEMALSGSGVNGYLWNYENGAVLFATNNTERVRIDSAGRVTMPYKPMFMAYPTTDYAGGSMPTGVIDMSVTYDNGNNFTAANDRFTAPVDGWYRTTWGGLQLPSTVTSLMINGTRTYNGNHVVGTLSYVTMTQTAIVELSAGDYLNIEGWNGGGYYNSWFLWTVEHIG